MVWLSNHLTHLASLWIVSTCFISINHSKIHVTKVRFVKTILCVSKYDRVIKGNNQGCVHIQCLMSIGSSKNWALNEISTWWLMNNKSYRSQKNGCKHRPWIKFCRHGIKTYPLIDCIKERDMKNLTLMWVLEISDSEALSL